MKRYFAVMLVLLLFTDRLQAQSVGIGTTTPHLSARLEISDTAKGLLIPRMTFQQRNAIASPAKGLLVYVTSDSTFYFFDGAWKPIPPVNDSWRINGNNNTDTSHFIGTVNNQPLRFRVNNQSAGFLNPANSSFSLGANSLPLTSTGNRNIGFGSNSLRLNTSGFGNIAIGDMALEENTAGNLNTGLGLLALRHNTIGSENTAVGVTALSINESGSNNVAVGRRSLFDNTAGSNNVAVGNTSLSFVTTGFGNVGVGTDTRIFPGTGDNNLVIGTRAAVVLSSGSLPVNATAIGANATVTASNKIRLGSSAVTVIEGQVPYSTPSDGRFKTDVSEHVGGLEFIMQLRPVSYHFNTKEYDRFLFNGLKQADSLLANRSYNKAQQQIQTGFIAQEVEAAVKKTGIPFDGLIVPENNDQAYGIAYSQFVIPLVKAVQEQQQVIGLLQKRVEALSAVDIPAIVKTQQQQINELEKIIFELKNKQQ
jgi:trimeric autotransporter adhesin